MNRVILMGRLVRDPDIKTTQSGMTIARMAIAVNRKGKPKDGQATADFINLVAFDRTAEFAGHYLSKGRQVLVEGHIQQGSYTDKDGNKRTSFDVVCDNLEFADSKPADSKPKGGDEQDEILF